MSLVQRTLSKFLSVLGMRPMGHQPGFSLSVSTQSSGEDTEITVAQSFKVRVTTEAGWGCGP